MAGPEIGGKKLQLLKELIPSVSRVAYLFVQGDEQTPGQTYIRETAPRLGITLVDVPIRHPTEAELRRAFDVLMQDRPDALNVPARGDFYGQRRLITELVEKSRLPAIFSQNAFVQLGGLISYGDDNLHGLRQLAVYVDRVLNGAKPAETPIDQPTKFLLAINLNTAKALGITVPQALLARADEVIE